MSSHTMDLAVYANGMVQHGLTSHWTHYRSFRGRFYGSDYPTNSVTALKKDG